MNETAVPKRGRGRPARPDHQVRAALVESAMALLLEEGYAAATMEAIAARAGTAKKTAYRFAANREDLVGLAVKEWTDRFVPVMGDDPPTGVSARTALRRILMLVASNVLSEDAIKLFRLLTTDFPGKRDLLERYQANGIDRARAQLAQWFERQHSRGLVNCPSPEPVANLVLAMSIAEPLRQAALGLIPPGPDAALHYIDGCLECLGGTMFRWIT